MKKKIVAAAVAAIAVATAATASAQADVAVTVGTTTTTVESTTSTTTSVAPATTVAVDIIRPQVISVQVSKSEVAYGESFDVSIEVVDNVEVVVAMVVPRFVRQSAAGVEYVDRYNLCVSGESWRAPAISSGDSTNGVWTMTCTVPSGIELGTYVFMPFAHDSSNNNSYLKDTSENPEVWATVIVK